MGAKFLCCLPLRLGVLIISFGQFIVALLAAGLLAFALIVDARDKDDKYKDLPQRTKIIAGVLCAIYGLVALISLTGFIGAIRKKESYVGLFSSLLRGFLVVQIGVTTAYFIFYFVDKDKFRKLCTGNYTDKNVIDTCESPSKVGVAVLIVSALIPILVQAYGVYIVASYAAKLHNGRDATWVSKAATYAPVAGREESHPLTQPQGQYPYADAAHSYGPKGAV
ncbi:hypothetical protein C8J57DRAFT_1215545 [Mycena rebaudengoi]|nr:hypothetical protein C8J57DRAFT_1215545 [Mycena rebaudengoi]